MVILTIELFQLNHLWAIRGKCIHSLYLKYASNGYNDYFCKQFSYRSYDIQEFIKYIFIINYKKKSSEFPFDVLRMQKLHERLDDPFPYYMQLRESWLNNVNSPRAAQAVIQLDKRLNVFLNRA